MLFTWAVKKIYFCNIVSLKLHRIAKTDRNFISNWNFTFSEYWISFSFKNKRYKNVVFRAENGFCIWILNFEHKFCICKAILLRFLWRMRQNKVQKLKKNMFQNAGASFICDEHNRKSPEISPLKSVYQHIESFEWTIWNQTVAFTVPHRHSPLSDWPSATWMRQRYRFIERILQLVHFAKPVKFSRLLAVLKRGSLFLVILKLLSYFSVSFK